MVFLSPNGEGEVAAFSAKHWDHLSREILESTTPCRDAQVVGRYQGALHSLEIANKIC